MQTTLDKWLSSRWWYALAATFVAYYLWNVSLLADSTPKFDDLNDVFGFFKQLALAHTPLQKIGAFFYPNNEHITAFSHLIYFIQYQLLGEIRFYPLILIGHIIIISTGCLLGIVVNNTRRPFYFAAMSIAYINLYYWDSSFKAMTAISNQAVILFAIATVFALLRWQKFYLALAGALLATFSQGNGMLIWPLGLLALLSNSHWQVMKWRYNSIWIITAALALGLYGWAHHTYGFESPATTSRLFLLLQKNPLLPALSALAFLGSTVFSAVHIDLAICLGASTLMMFLVCSWRNKNRNTLIVFIALFLIASTITASATRGLITGDASGVLESRYKMYSVTFVLLTLVYLCEHLILCARIKSSTLRTVLVLLTLFTALGINLTSYRLIPAIQNQAQKFSESYRNWLADGDFHRQTVYFPPMSDHFLFVAEHLHLFNFMQLAPNGSILAPLPAVSGRTCPPTPAPADLCPMTVRHHGNAIYVAIDAADNHQPAPANIILCDEQANAVMEFTIPETPASQQHWLIPEADIPAGTYRVLFQPAQQPACETQLIKKPRKVETEMRTLFGG